MGFHFKISVYGVTRCITRLKRLCMLTWYSSDRDWRMTSIVVRRPNEKVLGRDKVSAILDAILARQMTFILRHYDSRMAESDRDRDRWLTDIVCMFTCSGQHWHPATYEYADYVGNLHNRQTVFTITPTYREANEPRTGRIREEILRLIQIFMAPPTLVREPEIAWRLDLYVYKPSYAGSERELTRLVGLVLEPDEYRHMKALKVCVGPRGDYMACRTREALCFVLEQRLKDYLIVTDARIRKPKRLPSTFYGYTSRDTADALGKHTCFRAYDQLQLQTHGMFVVHYTFQDWSSQNAKHLADVLYDVLSRRALQIHAPAPEDSYQNRQAREAAEAPAEA